jgi:hypothetical protein
LKSTTTASSHQKEEVSSAGDKTQMYMGWGFMEFVIGIYWSRNFVISDVLVEIL